MLSGLAAPPASLHFSGDFNGSTLRLQSTLPLAGIPAPAAPVAVDRRKEEIYSREEIARLYEQHRRGAYRGREAEWRRQEADIIAAGREGRILNPDNVTK